MDYHNDYNRDTFWTSFDERNNIVRYYIKLNDVMIEVEKDVYHTMFNSYRKNLRTNKLNNENALTSLDAEQNGQGLYSVLSADVNVENEVYNKIIAESIRKAIDNLDDIDKQIVIGIFYENKTETAIGKLLGISKQAVQKRKQKIFKQLRIFINDVLQDIDY